MSRSPALPDKYSLVNNEAYWDDNEPFHNITITFQYQVVKKLTENLDERMRYQILLNLHYSNLLKEK